MDAHHSRSLRTYGAIIFWTLILEYVVGTYVDFFVRLPGNANDGQVWGFMLTQLPTALHIVFGVFLFVASIIFLIRVLRHHDARWKIPAILGFIGVLLTMFAGMLFVHTQIEAYSRLILLAFLMTLFSYGWGLAATRNPSARGSSDPPPYQ